MKKIYFASLVFLFLGFVSSSLFAQTSSSSSGTYSGIKITPEGVVSRTTNVDVGGLDRRQYGAFQNSFNSVPADVRTYSSFRCVSLNRLEKKIQENRGVVTDDMRYLAGLTRITHVFYFAETKDIVVAGPADGWFTTARAANRFVRPPCELQDLVTALRAFPPGKEGAPVVGCSIDPTEEGNARLQEFLQVNQGVVPSRRDEAQYVAGLKKSMGMQVVRVDGIPATTHAASVLVGADYQMKLIGVGLEQWRGIQSFVDLVDITKVSKNLLFRWYFVPDYQPIVVTEDKTAMRLVGTAVKLVGENELVLVTGERQALSGQVDRATAGFTESFTKNYSTLANHAPVFAQLQNFVDMLVCAAYIQKEDFYGKADWKMEFLGDEKKYAVETYNAPTSIEPVVGRLIRKQSRFAPPIGGGIEIQAENMLDAEMIQTDKDGKVAEAMANVKIESNPTNWWWDSK